MELTAFVTGHLRRPWAPGRVDCLLTLADWMIWRGYPDAAAHLRGTYEDEEGFRIIVALSGGAISLVGDCAARIGMARVSEPVEGAIAVIGSRSNMHKQFGAIWDGRNWRVRFVDTFAALRATPLAIWDI